MIPDVNQRSMDACVYELVVSSVLSSRMDSIDHPCYLEKVSVSCCFFILRKAETRKSVSTERALNGRELGGEGAGGCGGRGDGRKIDLEKSVSFLVLIHTFLIHWVAHFFDPVAEFMIKLVMDDGVRCVREIDTGQRKVDRRTDTQKHETREPAEHLRVRVPESPRRTVNHAEKERECRCCQRVFFSIHSYPR